MTHTVESLMVLAFDAMDAARVWAVKNDDLTLASLGRKREALRAALAEALAAQEWNDENVIAWCIERGIKASQPVREPSKFNDATLMQIVAIRPDLIESIQRNPSHKVLEPLTDAWIRERTKQPWVFETVKTWVREIEREHGIGVSK